MLQHSKRFDVYTHAQNCQIFAGITKQYLPFQIFKLLWFQKLCLHTCPKLPNQTWRWFEFQTKTGNSVILLQLFLENFLMDNYESNWAADSVKTLILKCRRLLPLFRKINEKLLVELITQILIGTRQRVDIKLQCQALM